MAQLVVTSDTRTPLRARLSSRRRGSRATHLRDRPRGEAADARATLAHVKVLEVALEEQVQRVAQLTEELATDRARPHEDVNRIAATVEGLRVAFGRDPVAQRLLARIDAALDRLVAPGELVRVALPEPEPVQRTAVPARATDTEQDADRPVEPGEAPESARVLPIPAEPEPATAPRHRRGLRR